jgi:phosphoenolpyruvate carboxykinase (GTP)
MAISRIPTYNRSIRQFVEDSAALTKPDDIVWITDEGGQLADLTKKALATGELIKLNEQLLPNCYLHRTAENDVARVEGRTFICSKREIDAGPTNNWMDPAEAYETLKGIYDGCMKGRTMYVIPFSMGALDSPFKRFGIELTDSIYVVLNMKIMTRIGKVVLNVMQDTNDFVRGLHSKAELDESKRYICHFPEDNTIWSVNSGYGGNVLLGKKCFALRIASYQGKSDEAMPWMAEHMLILGIEYPNKETKYIAAAFPSACGKTNLAMLIPPEGYQKAGYKVWCVGDDIAWIRIKGDGRMYAVNPEYGFFGVAPGTNAKSNPNALATCRRDTIFTNVVQNLDDNTVWWEGMGTPAPENAIDWKGNPWTQESGVKGAHPNSRFTAPSYNCPCLSPKYEDPNGVPLTAIIFGGRRAKTAPLVFQSRDWTHGVFVGSTIASETTAAASGAVGVVRRDPMAMLPFCGYHMGDYFAHWLRMGTFARKAPKIFHVNWFRTDDEGKFIWPGYGDNLRVLDWIIKRCAFEVDAVETPIGFLPLPEDINLEGTDVSAETLKELLTVDPEVWTKEAADIEAFYEKFGDKLPHELRQELAALKNNLTLRFRTRIVTGPLNETRKDSKGGNPEKKGFFARLFKKK